MNVPCPTCRGPSTLDRSNRWKPFCSERCRLIDLGGWFEERFVIAGEDAQDEASSEPSRPEPSRRETPGESFH